MATKDVKPKKCSQKFYAVAVGRTVGIFQDWSEAHASTDKYPGACHKSFKDLSGAKNFLACNGQGIGIGNGKINDNKNRHDGKINNEDNTEIDNGTYCSDESSNLSSCILCTPIDDEYMIQCHDCTSWMHYKCTELLAYFRTNLRKQSRSILASDAQPQMKTSTWVGITNFSLKHCGWERQIQIFLVHIVRSTRPSTST